MDPDLREEGVAPSSPSHSRSLRVQLLPRQLYPRVSADVMKVLGLVSWKEPLISFCELTRVGESDIGGNCAGMIYILSKVSDVAAWHSLVRGL